MDPIERFQEWYATAHAASPLRHPGAFCLSTIDEAGYPDGRFVDLKTVSHDGFVFGTHMDSQKGAAIARDPRVALTFWWDHIERQVRVRGIAEPVADHISDAMFAERSRDGRIVTLISRQSAPLADPDELAAKLAAARVEHAAGPIARPPRWGGYCVVPQQMEFLTFADTRLHERLLYTRMPDGWHAEWLQP